MAFELKYLGHSAFEISTEKGNLLIDPFLALNPNYQPQNIKDIFVTHGHSDHLGSAIEISKNQGATITAIFELANYCVAKGSLTNGVSFGGELNFEWGKAIFIPAFHSSSTPEGIYAGEPAGILFEIEGLKLFHAGDSGLTQEYKTLNELYKPNIAILPIGGHFTMDISHACIAAEWIGAKTIIPMHYNSFPPIKVDVNLFKTEIEKLGKTCLVPQINETIHF